MSLLKSLDDRGAVLEWCPISAQGATFAVGTKDAAGAGFDDYGGELELHRCDLSSPGTDTQSLGKVKAR